MNWKFKRTLFGKQVLMKKCKIVKKGGIEYSWKYANQDDVVDFTTEIKKLLDSIKVVKNLKDTHPEFFL